MAIDIYPMGKSLYIDTTGPGTELLFRDGGRNVPYRGYGRQSEEIFAAIESVLGGARIADLDFAAVIAGPGSFTGIRLGLSVAKGFQIAAKVPVFGPSRFKAVFITRGSPGPVALDAGNDEVYYADLDADGDPIAPPELRKGAPGADTHIDPAKVLDYLAKSNAPPDHLEPLYIKPHYAKIPK